MSMGKTRAVRVENIKQLKNEIANTGFGLGHFYISNSLTDE